MILRKSFYIRWSAGRSPRVHEVNPGRDPSDMVFLGWSLLVVSVSKRNCFHACRYGICKFLGFYACNILRTRTKLRK